MFIAARRENSASAALIASKGLGSTGLFQIQAREFLGIVSHFPSCRLIIGSDLL